MHDDDLLTIAEVAALLKLNQQTVRNWINDGKLPCVRVGYRRIRVRRGDLEEMIKAPTTPRVAARQRLVLASAAVADAPAGDDAVLVRALSDLAEAARALAATIAVSRPLEI